MKKSNYYLLIIIGLFSVLNYVPFNPINVSILIYFSFIILILNNISNILKQIKDKIYILFVIILILIYYYFIYLFNNNIYTGDLYAIILSFFIFMVFSSIKYKISDRNRLINIISIISITFTMFSVLYYYKTFLSTENYIEGQYYFKGKNGLGPMLSFAGFWFLYNINKTSKKVFNFILFLISLILLAYIKARTSFLALLIVSIIFIIKKIKLNRIKTISLLIILLIILLVFCKYINYFLLYAFNIDFINKSLNGYIDNSEYLDIISSGRVDHYKYGFYLLNINPMFGACFDKYKVSNAIGNSVGIHSFFIRSLGYGGIFYLSIVLLLILFYIIYFKRYCEDKKITVYLMLIGLIGMLFEPIAPFGPGTSYLLFWIILCLNNKKNINEELNT
ncbi:O-antigen ligase family protein [Clostridium perfringens]|nr:O-antigen ligase family protein [Clostridium perfringens]